jgi:hypothetical protein
MLFILSFIKALILKDNQRNYKGTYIKRIIIIIIKYISANNKYFKLIIIWLINIY